MEKTSTVCRRLRHLFNQKPTPKAAAVVPIPKVVPIAVPTAQDKYESLVERFKKNSSSAGFRKNRNEYKFAVNYLARSGQFSHIEEIIHHQKQYPDIKDEHFTARLIVLYGKSNMLDRARQLFDEMPELNCPRTVLSFNALLTACLSSENFDKAIHLFQELPSKLSIEPNVISHTQAIRAFCKKGLFENAVSMVEEMESKGVYPNITTFDLILAELYHGGRFSEGEKVWKLMTEKNVEPELKSYNSRMHGLVTENLLSQGVEMVKEMKSKGVEPNSYTYNQLIKGFVKEGNGEEVRRLYAELEESSAPPVIFTYVGLIPFALEQNDVDLAFELCKKSVGLKGKLSAKMVGRVIDGLVKHGKDEEADELRRLFSMPE